MSYTRSVTRQIPVHFSGSETFSYPASQTGGTRTVHYSGTTVETVNVNVHVDTSPFDRSVSDCNGKVDLLTGSVVATEAAEVKNIRRNALKVGETIVEGFFQTVRFEIATQIVELQKKVESLLLDLKDKQKALLALKDQMNKDYMRTSERYAKIFNDLNQELSNRVHAIDQPVFATMARIQDMNDRAEKSDLQSIVTLAGKEESLLNAQLGVAVAKQHAQKALGEAHIFLSKKQATQRLLDQSTFSECVEQTYYAPVCCIQTNNPGNVVNTVIHSSRFFTTNVDAAMYRELDMSDLAEQSAEAKEAISTYLNRSLNEIFDGDDQHTKRLRSTIAQLMNH